MENIVLWGASGLTKQILTESMTISDYNVLGIVDNDAGKHGINFYGVKVFSADFILENREKIDAIEKLTFESEFQKISSGGAISYVEIPNMQNNILALESAVKFIYDNIQYAEFNTKSDYCQVCGFDGKI